MENRKTIEEIKKDLLIDDLICTDANSEEGKYDCIKKLQKIGTKLLQEYVICIDKYTIEPLLIEAYYYNEAVGFEDENMHRDDGQMNHFGELYFHKSGRGGVDICLSDKKGYYLSFLIKNSLINTEPGLIIRQTKLYDLLKKHKDSEQIVLKKREDKKDSIVFYTVRKGLVKDNSFKDKKLTAVTGFDLRDKDDKRYSFDFETGYGKEWTVAEYMNCHKEDDRIAQCKALIGYNSSTVLKILEEMENNK